MEDNGLSILRREENMQFTIWVGSGQKNTVLYLS